MKKRATNKMRSGVKLLILTLLLTAQNIFAQTDRAWQSYRSGDLENAEKQAQIGYKQARSNRERAQARKLASIIAYSLGKTNLSKEYFSEARRLDPSIRILESETLDPSIIAFLGSPSANTPPRKGQPAGQKTSATARAFVPAKSGQKSKTFVARAPQNSPQRKAASQTSKPLNNQVGSQSTEVNASSRAQTRESSIQKNKSTYIQVTSNVRNATLSLDGILAGNVGQLIEVSPGVVNFEVGAPGYKSVSQRINLAKGETKKIVINLQKIIKTQPSVQNKNRNLKPTSQPLAKKPKEVPNMFDDDLLVSKPVPNTSVPAGDGMNYQPAPIPQPSGKGLSLGISSGNSQGNMQGNLQGSPGSLQPQYGGSNMQGAGNSQVYNPSAPGGASYPNYQGQYPNTQYPNTQYPMAMPNTPQYNIPYGGQWPAQNQYYPAPYPTPYVPQSTVTIVPIYPSGTGGLGGGAMGYDPYGSYGYPSPAPPSPYGGDQFGGTQDPFAGSSKKKKKKKKKVKTNMALSVLPLGIPQFSTGKPLLGTLFGGGQIAGAYLWYKNGNDAKTSRSSAQAELKSREEIAPTLPDAEQEAYYADTDTYKAAMEKYIKNLENYQTYSILGAGALWGISIIESIAFGSSTAAQFEMEDTSNIAEEKNRKPQWYFSPLPDQIILGAKWDF